MDSAHGDDKRKQSNLDMEPTERTAVMMECGEASFPAAEEVRTANMTTLRPQKRCSRRKLVLMIGACVALFTLVVIVPAAVIKHNKSSSFTAAASDNNAATKVNDPSNDFDAVVTYLTGQEVSTGNALRTLSSPQNLAALWMAEKDPANLTIPTTGMSTAEGYRFVARYVMALFYYATRGDEWISSLRFLSGLDICSWNDGKKGVFCSTSTTDPLFPRYAHFADIDLHGKIPTEVGKLVSLYALTVGGNDALEGRIPTELCALTSLKNLELQHCALSGQIPHCVGELTNMSHFLLNDNKLEGWIPASIANLWSNLRFLFVDDNMLTGDPLTMFSKLTNLELLMANNNQFVGEINGDWFLADSHNLKGIDLSHNSFSGSIPSHLFDLSLEVMDFSMNSLHGFPEVLPVNHELRIVSVYGNELEGSLPKSLRNLQGLNHLDLSNNKFEGPIIDDIGQMTELRVLFLSENPFESGAVPSTFENLTNLTELSLRNTNRNGALPQFAGAANLVMLDLGSNDMTGEIPASYGRFRELAYLLLNNNPKMSGTMPSTFANNTELRVAFLDGTSLSGSADVLCNAPVVTMDISMLYVDCGDRSFGIECTCNCQCCPWQIEGGCSRPLLSNLDASWENRFHRVDYAFKNNSVVDVPYPTP